MRTTHRPAPSGFGVPTDPSLAARLLRSVALELTARVEHRLPGIADSFARRVVVCANGDHLVSWLGSYVSPAWKVGNESFDKLTVAVRHTAHQDPDPLGYARSIISTLAHEIAHAYTHAYGIEGTTGPGRVRHTEDFAYVAQRLGLRIVRRPEQPTVIFTPGLSPHGLHRFDDLVTRVARAGISRTRGIAYAGPQRFHDLDGAAAAADLSPASTSSVFTR